MPNQFFSWDDAGVFSPCCGVLDHQPVPSSGQADHGIKPKVRAGAQAMYLLLSTDPEGLLGGGSLA